MAYTPILALVAAAIAVAPAALARSGTHRVALTVPVHCAIEHDAADAAGSALGRIREYCNAPGGYDVVVRYAPGRLNGTVIAAGDDRVTLDGSGEATLSRVPGPRILERAVNATPGGTDVAAALNFAARPNGAL